MPVSNNQQAAVRQAAAQYVAEIRQAAERPLRLMEVCGTHTVAIFKAGIRQLLPENIELVSGPGCPVCVTPHHYMDTAIAYSRQPDIMIATFGDMLRVPGSASSLNQEKAAGADIRVVYSPLEALALAQANPQKKIIFLAVGFETTAPTAAAVVMAAAQQHVTNFYLLSAHKQVPPALTALLTAEDVQVDGFLLPGHVCAVLGEQPFSFLAAQYRIPAVVTGFAPLEILAAVHRLVLNIQAGQTALANQYQRVVPPNGNPEARRLLNEVYESCDTAWRGLGWLPSSGLQLRANYRHFDVLASLPLQVAAAAEPRGCRCGDVLRGVVRPQACPLFGTRCTPEQPVGSCMVSVEGACAAWYKYGSGRWQL